MQVNKEPLFRGRQMSSCNLEIFHSFAIYTKRIIVWIGIQNGFVYFLFAQSYNVLLCRCLRERKIPQFTLSPYTIIQHLALFSADH